MKWLDLDMIKDQLRIEHDDTTEDKLLTRYGNAAEETVLNLCATTTEQLVEKYGEVPVPLIQGALMLVDVSYQYRSPVSDRNFSAVPYTFDLLIKPYMIL